MMTKEEAYKLKEIKSIARDGRLDQISAEEKQWVLDILAREKVAVDPRVIQGAKAQGFNVQSVKSM